MIFELGKNASPTKLAGLLPSKDAQPCSRNFYLT
jgi:hypothetical protein